MDDVLLVISNDAEYLGEYLTESRNMQVHGLTRDGIKFLSDLEKRVEMSSSIILCMNKSLRWHGRISAVAGDAAYIDIKRSISCW